MRLWGWRGWQERVLTFNDLELDLDFKGREEGREEGGGEKKGTVRLEESHLFHKDDIWHVHRLH